MSGLVWAAPVSRGMVVLCLRSLCGLIRAQELPRAPFSCRCFIPQAVRTREGNPTHHSVRVLGFYSWFSYSMSQNAFFLVSDPRSYQLNREQEK